MVRTNLEDQALPSSQELTKHQETEDDERDER
jgi:hypothetical protein